MIRNNEIRRTIFASTIVALLFIIVVIATHNVFTRPYPGHNDFMTPLEATRAFWLDGLNPYGPEATERIQNRIFGRPPLPEEDPGYFSYPFFTTFLLLPFVSIHYAWASAIWMVLLEACLIIALFIILDMFRWQPRPGLMTILILWALFFYPGARGLLLGQLSHFGYMLQMLGIWALLRRRDNVAGIAFAVSTFKPQMGYLLIPLLLLWAMKERRWRFIGVFSAVFLAMIGAAFVIYPAWLAEWLNRLRLYPTYTLGSPVWIITQYYLNLGRVGEWGLTLALYAALLWSWRMLLVQNHTERFMWVIIWTLTITHIVAPRTASPHFVVFTLPVVFYCRALVNRPVVWGKTLILGSFFILPWVHFVLTVGGVAGEQEDPSTHILMPFFMLGLLWATRQMWWNAPFVPRPDPVAEVSPHQEEGQPA